MNVNERNALALNEVQKQQRAKIQELTERVATLEKANADLRQDLQNLKVLVLPKIMGTGATA